MKGNAMNKLYISEGTCSLPAQIVANELGIELELIHVDVKTDTYSGGNYLEINPHGYVPALELENGIKIFETVAVTQYLAELNPESSLLPPIGSFDRIKSLELQMFIATEIHQKFIPVFRDYVSENAKNEFRNLLIESFSTLDARLADGRQYLTGNGFTVSDAYLFTMMSWTERTETDISHFKNLKKYAERISLRPSVRRALLDEVKS
jgi:glutathione S-transferase